jgi:hypothetical protein
VWRAWPKRGPGGAGGPGFHGDRSGKYLLTKSSPETVGL